MASAAKKVSRDRWAGGLIDGRMRDPCWHVAHSTHSKPHSTPLTPIRIAQLASLKLDVPDPRLRTKLHACTPKCTLIKRADCTHKTHPRSYKHDNLLHTLFTLADVNCVLHFVSWIAGVRSLKERLQINSAAVKEKKNQLSSDKYIVPGSFLSRIQRDIYHCSWVEKREGV